MAACLPILPPSVRRLYHSYVFRLHFTRKNVEITLLEVEKVHGIKRYEDGLSGPPMSIEELEKGMAQAIETVENRFDIIFGRSHLIFHKNDTSQSWELKIYGTLYSYTVGITLIKKIMQIPLIHFLKAKEIVHLDLKHGITAHVAFIG